MVRLPAANAWFPFAAIKGKVDSGYTDRMPQPLLENNIQRLITGI